MNWYTTIGICLMLFYPCFGSEILMMTMAITKSHKMLLMELAKGLASRNHSITLISGFSPDYNVSGITEITPMNLTLYLRNYSLIDIVNSRSQGFRPYTFTDAIRFLPEACEAFLYDDETKDLLASNKRYDLIVIDGSLPECYLGLVYHFKTRFIYFNTVGLFINHITNAGSPGLYSTTPFMTQQFTDKMGPVERVINFFWHNIGTIGHYITSKKVHNVLKKHFDPQIPNLYEISKNVSFILQNTHPSIYYSRAYLPNVAEIACIHCKPSKPLKNELEQFIQRGGDRGFIFISMGTYVQLSKFPQKLKKIFLRSFARLPYQVLWKWEDNTSQIEDFPSNVMISKWLPQQDLLGHKKMRAIVSHGGLLSIYETVYHGVPIVTIPIFVDQDSNSAKAVEDGYGVKLELSELTSESLYNAIMEITKNPKYKENVKKRQILLKDQKEHPLDRAIYWTEYVIRHENMEHLSSPSKNMSLIVYYSIDTISIIIVLILIIILLMRSLKYVWNHDHIIIFQKIKTN